MDGTVAQTAIGGSKKQTLSNAVLCGKIGAQREIYPIAALCKAYSNLA